MLACLDAIPAMEETMAYALPALRSVVLRDAFSQIARTVLRLGAATQAREGDHPYRRARPLDRDDRRSRAIPLDATIMRDLGLCRECLDYASPVAVPAAAAGRLHRLADAARWRMPR